MWKHFGQLEANWPYDIMIISETAFYICVMKPSSFQSRHLAKFLMEVPKGRKDRNESYELPRSSKCQVALCASVHLKPNDGQLPGPGPWGNFGGVCYMAPLSSYSWTRTLKSPVAKTNEWTENGSNGDWIKLGEREKKVIQSTENSQEFCLNGSGLQKKKFEL